MDLPSVADTWQVQRLQRVSLRNPAKVEVTTEFKTVSGLIQRYVFIPFKYKVCAAAIVDIALTTTGLLPCLHHQ
jgi:hypothetical protein